MTEQTWADWLALRKAKKAPVTETVLTHAAREAGKAGMPLDEFLGIWCARGSQGLEAAWLTPTERAGRGPPLSAVERVRAANAAAGFHDDDGWGVDDERVVATQ